MFHVFLNILFEKLFPPPLLPQATSIITQNLKRKTREVYHRSPPTNPLGFLSLLPQSLSNSRAKPKSDDKAKHESQLIYNLESCFGGEFLVALLSFN